MSLGTHYVIGLEAMNCVTGGSFAREQREARNKEEVLTELGKAASSLRGKLGESLASIQKFDTPIEDATTTSLEALRLYTEGLKQNRAGNFRQGLLLAERATETDPNFASAYGLLATTHRNLGQVPASLEYSAKAYALRDRVSGPEKMRITGIYHSYRGDVTKTIETYEVSKQMYPHNYNAHSLANEYAAVGRYADALTEYQEAIRQNPNSALSQTNLALVYSALNRFEEAQAVVKKAMERKLESIDMHRLLYAIAFIRGDRETMQREVDWAKGRPDESNMIFIQVQAAASSGKVGEARKLLNQAVDMEQRGGRREVAAGYRSFFALIEALFGNDRQARAQSEEALRISPILTSVEFAVPALGFAGNHQAIRTLIGEAKKEHPQDTFMNSIFIPTALAALEIRSGNGAKAIELLNAAKSYEPGPVGIYATYTRATAYLQTKSGREAAAEFQKILEHHGAFPFIYPALSQLGLARAYTLTGDLPNARKCLQVFLASWKDADPDIPILVQAKREYAKLASN